MQQPISATTSLNLRQRRRFRMAGPTTTTSRRSLTLLMLVMMTMGVASGLPKLRNTAADEKLSELHAVYDNQITGEPEIECGYGVVHFRVPTSKGKASAVYVRGQMGNSDCVFHDTKNVTIELAKCNIRRKREVDPTGVAYQMTVVVQLHPLFVTKVDRAYNVNCFYMEKRQNVNVEFGVSELTTAMLAREATLPTCTYSVHRDSPNGPLVKYTKVGEQLYHVWECPSTMYSMLLYNCSAIDGKGSEYGIVDENGCSLDEYLMPQITYTADNSKAMAASAAFNFPDRNTMSFNCKIRLCYNNECKAITPPKCGNKSTPPASATASNNIEQSIEEHTNQPSDDLLHPSSSSSTVTATSSEAPHTRTSIAFQTSSSGEAVKGLAVGRINNDLEEESSSSTSVESTAASTTTTPLPTTTTTPPTTTNSTTTTATTTGLTSPSSANSDEQSPLSLADDFPRPADLPIGGEFLLDGDAGTARRKKPSTTTTASSSTEEIQASTPPMTLFKKNAALSAPSMAVASSANSKHSEAAAAVAAANRQQRDTTAPAASKSGGNGGGSNSKSRTVDFDITSPELTIMDDYLEPGSAAAQRQSDQQRDISLFGNSASRVDSGFVCFSSTALIVAGVMVLLLVGAVTFVLFQSWRKSVHAFY